MKVNKLFLIGIFFLLAFTSACSGVSGINPTIEGSGKIITEERNVSGFDRVTLAGFGEVTIEQGDKELLTVSTDDNIMPYVTTKVKNNTLILEFDDTGKNRNYIPTNSIKFTLVVTDLSQISISGAGEIIIDKLETEKLVVGLSGAGSLKIAALTADELVVIQSGAGAVLVAGQVKEQKLTHSGIGSFYAADLESETAIIDISGAGTATLWATESLDVNISGVGNVIYAGTPRITQNISGIGKLVRAEK